MMKTHHTIRLNDLAVTEMQQETMKKLLIPFAEVMLSHAKTVPPSPYDTGHNRDSIRMEPAFPSLDAEGLSIVTESNYGGWLEVGTSKMAAQPYIYPAFQKAKQDFGVSE